MSHPTLRWFAVCALIASVLVPHWSVGAVRSSVTVVAKDLSVHLAPARTALVIGNSAYHYDPLSYPTQEAQAIADTLKGLGFEVSLYLDVNKQQIHDAVHQFAQRLKARGGLGLFYYSGHGVQLNGINYLIPINALIHGEADVDAEAYRVDRVLHWLEEVNQAGFNLVILDACRNRPFKSSSKGGNLSGLAQMSARTGQAIAYATAPDTIAMDGIYTRYLLAGLKRPGVKLLDMLNEVNRTVQQASEGKQVPWTSFSSIPPLCLAGGCSDDQNPEPIAQPSAPPSLQLPVYSSGFL